MVGARSSVNHGREEEERIEDAAIGEVSREEGVPGHDVPVGHFVEHLPCHVNGATLGEEVDELILEEEGGGVAGTGDVRAEAETIT